MKQEIILSILLELLSKKSVSASYLSDKYQVSVRTIYRYMEDIEGAGVPIYTIRGNNGGFSIVDTYKLPSTFLTKKESDQVISALKAVNEGVDNKELASAILKLQANKKNENNGFSVQGGNLVIDAGPWGDTRGYKYKLSIVQQSIDTLSQLQIKYHDRNGEITERNIEPHLIVFKQGLWYVYAYCNLRQEFRFFKIGRIESANIQSTKFTRRELSQLDLPLDFWHSDVTAEEVKLEIRKNILSDVEEWLGIENVKEVNGKFIAEAFLPYDKGLISKIMSYGSGIKVLKPQKLKEEIEHCCRDIINNYK